MLEAQSTDFQHTVTYWKGDHIRYRKLLESKTLLLEVQLGAALDITSSMLAKTCIEQAGDF